MPDTGQRTRFIPFAVGFDQPAYILPSRLDLVRFLSLLMEMRLISTRTTPQDVLTGCREKLAALRLKERDVSHGRVSWSPQRLRQWPGL